MASEGALSRGDSRIYAQRFIVSGVRAGLSGNQILQNLRSVEVGGKTLGYRTENFYEDYNRYLNAKTLPRRTSLPSLPKNFSLDYSFALPSRGGNRWNYVAHVSGTNSTTGDPTEIDFSFSSATPIIDELLPNAFEQAFENMYSQVEYSPEDVEFMEPRQFYSQLP